MWSILVLKASCLEPATAFVLSKYTRYNTLSLAHCLDHYFITNHFHHHLLYHRRHLHHIIIIIYRPQLIAVDLIVINTFLSTAATTICPLGEDKTDHYRPPDQLTTADHYITDHYCDWPMDSLTPVQEYIQ